MIGRRSTSQRRGKDEAEKPFWISYSDLMTALMVLFLVVMAVALVAITGRDGEHKKKISQCMALAVDSASRHEGVRVDLDRNVIDFGDRARFGFNSSVLSPDQEGVLREFVPELLSMADSATCKRVLKRIVVEGYTDKTGNYLSNLNLSLMRSQRVLCAMFKTDGPNPLTTLQKEEVRNVFLVGGFAFNSSKDTAEESRRVEMRIEFLGIDEMKIEVPMNVSGGFGSCAI
jgi:flagellar motor protein MotB